MMRRMPFATALLISMLSVPVAAQLPSFQAPSGGTSGAALLGPLLTPTIERIEDTDFGRVISDRQLPGTVAISEQGTVLANGGAIALPGMRSVSRYRIRGTAHRRVEILVPTSASLAGPLTSLTLTDIRVLPDSVVQLDGAGNAEVRIVATLVVPGGTRGGPYSASVPITFDYLSLLD